ncbi:MAG: MFS transporter, partial [Demequina sp.]|nr:MFS transporter [Demequina sp.]
MRGIWWLRAASPPRPAPLRPHGRGSPRRIVRRRVKGIFVTTAVPAPLLSRRQINLIVGGLMVGMFLAAFDQMIVATAIRTIGDDLNGLTLQAWVTTAYLIAATISTPLYGKLSDIFGRKPLYVLSISSFVVGSLLCGTATSMFELAAYRAIQGLGAGGLMALALIILGDMLSPRERTKYQALFFGVWG